MDSMNKMTQRPLKGPSKNTLAIIRIIYYTGSCFSISLHHPAVMLFLVNFDATNCPYLFEIWYLCHPCSRFPQKQPFILRNFEIVTFISGRELTTHISFNHRWSINRWWLEFICYFLLFFSVFSTLHEISDAILEKNRFTRVSREIVVFLLSESTICLNMFVFLDETDSFLG